MPFLGDGNAGPYVIANPLPTLSFGDGSEDVKAALEPVVKAVRNFDGLVFGVICGINTI
jgi:hypothetical protein